MLSIELSLGKARVEALAGYWGETISLADCGLTPYRRNGRWNENNYLIPVDNVVSTSKLETVQ
ncbi:MAG: hypothetical protein KKH88_01650 [Nanoarchaeota archaeon]|nr:hypothetical protein [Nanoarchaeota archaeon]